MKQWLSSYLQLDNDIESNEYRKIVTSKFIILVSFTILSILVIGNVIYGNTSVLVVDTLLLTAFFMLLFISGPHQQYSSHFVLHAMAVGILIAVYLHHGQEYTPIWSFLYTFLVMSLYGHKMGLRIALGFLTLLLLILFSFTGGDVTMMEFTRFTMAALFALFFAYLAEVLISNTIERLIFAKAQLEKLSKTDALTGLFNRRHFNDILLRQMNIIKRNEDVLALVIIDIDHFKHYNDNYGHPAGDLALIAIATLLNSHMRRANDTIFRIGGEEFALLYQVKNNHCAQKIIEDIRLAVTDLGKKVELEANITVSAGLLCINASSNLMAEAAYKLADEALYLAKESGRNKVVISTA